MKTQLIFKYIGMGIIAMLLAMCEAGVTPTDTTKIYIFSYKTTPQGTADTLSPTWYIDIPNVTYEIGGWVDNTETNKATIDASTGEVTIATDTIAGSYTVSAISADTFTEIATTKVYVMLAPADKNTLTTRINEGIAVWGNEGDFNYIITSTITDMSKLFLDPNYGDNVGYQLFNGDITKWNTSNVTNMSDMFVRAAKFNQPIGNWNTSEVQNMSQMFNGATLFNQPIGDWNTSKVQNMESMFEGASKFNKDIDGWNVGAVTDALYMFINSGMKNIPCWFNSKGGSGYGAILDPRPDDCPVAD